MPLEKVPVIAGTLYLQAADFTQTQCANIQPLKVKQLQLPGH